MRKRNWAQVAEATEIIKHCCAAAAYVAPESSVQDMYAQRVVEQLHRIITALRVESDVAPMMVSNPASTVFAPRAQTKRRPFRKGEIVIPRVFVPGVVIGLTTETRCSVLEINNRTRTLLICREDGRDDHYTVSQDWVRRVDER